MADLRTDYKDDVLNINTNERRKYRMINNADGTISFEDVTDYVQNGDSFGATDVNAITERVNKSLTGADVVDNFESTAPDLPFSANKGREMYVNGVPFLKVSSVIDGEGNPFRPGDFKDSAISFGYVYGATIGLNVAAYVPIITSRWYDTSDVIRTTQLAIMGTGTAVRYSTSETTWSDWEYQANKSNTKNGTVACSYVNSTTLYGQINHTLGDSYNCIATPSYVGDNPLEDFTDLSVVTVRHNNLVEFYVKGNGFTNDSGIYVDFLLTNL